MPFFITFGVIKDELNSEEYPEMSMPKSYEWASIRVCFNVTGHDHSGYCSDAEAHDGNAIDRNEKSCYRITDWKIEDFFKPGQQVLKHFKHSKPGCTCKDGSRTCTGFYRDYNPSDAELYEICIARELSDATNPTENDPLPYQFDFHHNGLSFRGLRLRMK